MKKVFIMRGLPGAGKTTWLAKNYPEANICSADAFRVGPDGKYYYDARKDAEVHDLCLRRFIQLLYVAKQPVAVDNTNIRAWELATYYRLGELYEADPEIVWVHAHPTLCQQRNTHGLPPQRILDWAVSFDPLPPWWKVRHVMAEGGVVPGPEAGLAGK